MNEGSSKKQIKEFIIEEYTKRDLQESFTVFADKMRDIVKDKRDNDSMEQKLTHDQESQFILFYRNVNKILQVLGDELGQVRSWNNCDRIKTIDLKKWKVKREKEEIEKLKRQRNSHLRKMGLKHLIF